MAFDPIILCGPSGVGKGYLVSYLEKNFPCEEITRLTTRQIRPGEVNGKSYYFLTEQEFLARKESLLISSYFNGAWYGGDQESVEKIRRKGLIPIGDIRLNFVPRFLEFYPSSQTIFLKPISFELLKERMILRGDNESDIASRLANAEEEIKLYEQGLKSYFKQEFIIGDNDISPIIEGLHPFLGVEDTGKTPAYRK